MKRNFVILALLGILSLNTLGETDHGTTGSTRAVGVPPLGNTLGFSACTAGRPPFLSNPPQGNLVEPVPTTPPVAPPVSVPKPEPKVVAIPPKAERPKEPVCPVENCTQEFSPVECTATLWVDDMGISAKASGSNRCEAGRALCKTVAKSGFKEADVREVTDLKCTASVVD